MNKLPIELHLVHGTKPEHNPIVLPESVKKRIPQAEWMDNPDAWDNLETKLLVSAVSPPDAAVSWTIVTGRE